jgi:hypothetical protein
VPAGVDINMVLQIVVHIARDFCWSDEDSGPNIGDRPRSLPFVIDPTGYKKGKTKSNDDAADRAWFSNSRDPIQKVNQSVEKLRFRLFKKDSDARRINEME